MSKTYKASGVDVNRGYEAVQRIKPYAKDTNRLGVMSNIGAFAGLFNLGKLNYKEPVLVSGTDGVGTKLLLAKQFNQHDTVGQDLVAMCVNDIVVMGATPLFFLDYIAVGAIDPNHIEEIIKGIHKGCKLSECALIGGETAEMPDMYKDGHYDLAGFAVGVVEKENIITGENIQESDVLIGLPSSGLHSNGFSLVRKILYKDQTVEIDEALKKELLTPTKIYVKPILEVIKSIQVHGLVHITGGGFDENIPRVLHHELGVTIHIKDIPKPKIFDKIQLLGNLDIREMYEVFNMGVGMVIFVRKQDALKTLEILRQSGEKPFIMGHVTNKKGIDFIW